jgi:hypothetical protein
VAKLSVRYASNDRNWMNWITDAPQFRSVLLEARSCVFIDSARLPTTLIKLVFDDAELLTRRFAGMLHNLLVQSEDEFVWYLVLNPDPELYFYEAFKSYPLAKMNREITASEYLNILNDGPEDSPVDALGTNWHEAVLLPPSKRWFVHMLRSSENNGGHLWIPSEWKENILEHYPFFR